ncbi:MAG TPA: DUF4337 domain-containing protein, partial [Paludibacter sp.]
KDVLVLETLKIPKWEKGISEAYQKKINEYELSVKRYDKEKSEIKKDAENFESMRDEAKKHSNEFGMAVIFLQISILISSIAALIKKKYLWILGIAVGVVGLVYFMNGFLLFL